MTTSTLTEKQEAAQSFEWDWERLNRGKQAVRTLTALHSVITHLTAMQTGHSSVTDLHFITGYDTIQILKHLFNKVQQSTEMGISTVSDLSIGRISCSQICKKHISGQFQVKYGVFV